MNTKRILLSLFAGVVGATILSVSAMAQTNEITFADFLENVEAGNGEYDGNGVTVKLTTTNGCVKGGDTCATCEYALADASTPNRIQGTNAQYHLFSGDKIDIEISNVNFVADKANGAAICHGGSHGWNGAFAKGDTFNVELQFENHGNIAFDDCSFDGLNISLYLDGSTSNNGLTATIENCEFEDVYSAYGIKQVNAANVLIDNNTFENCAGGAYITNGCNGIVISNNEFSDMGTYATEEKQHTSGLIQIAASVNLNEGANIAVLNNESDGSTPVFRQLSASVDTVFTSNNDFGNCDMYTADVDDYIDEVVPVASIDGTYYGSLQDAINAADKGDVIVLVSDIEYENYVYASGKTTSVNIPKDKEFTLDLNGYTISGKNNTEKSFEFITITNGAIVTIDDTSSDKTGKITYEGTRETLDSWMLRAHTIFNQGTLILNGGTIENTTDKDTVSTAIDNNCSWGNLGSFTMNGGVVISTAHYGIRTDINTHNVTATGTNKAVTAINGGTVYGISLSDRGNDNAAWAENNIEFTVDDGVVIETGNAGNATTAISIRKNAESTVSYVISDDAKVKGTILGVVGKIGNNFYTSLDEAIKAAVSGDVIDLFGNTVKLPEPNTLKITKDLTIENGTLDITNGVWNGDAVIMVKGGTATDFVTLTLNNVDFVGDNYSSAFGVVYVTEYGKAVINECNFELSNERFSGGGVLKGNGVAQSAFDVTKSTFNLENPNRVITNATVALDEVTIDAVVTDEDLVAGDMNNHALRNCVGTIENSKISVDGFETGIKNTDGDLVVSDNSSVILTNSVVADIVLTAGNDITVDESSELLAETSDIASGATIEGVVVKADTVYIQYKKTDIDGTADTLEGADTYEIVLAGYDSEKINELASADLTFNFVGTPYTGAAMTYTVTPADGVTLTQLGDRYMFNYNGVDKYEETGAAIVIGTIEVAGYGSYYLGTADVNTNAVYATEIRDNIVDGFDTAASLVVNTDMVANDGMVGEVDGIEIVVPTRALTINVDFPNAVENNNYDYQQMKVTVSGGDLDEALVIELGNDYTIDLSAYTDKTDCAATAVFENGAYEVTLTKLLTADVAYNVEVSGAGYRTARYTVTMQGEDTDGKVLNFWNNVKDNAIEVEEDKASSAKTVTYLAGDIVKDSLINIYDLSAVVSYFGEEMSTDEYNAYAKYDLNRDRKIDSKDVAYVLVSWNN